MKQLFFFILMIISTQIVSSQSLRLNAYGAYVFNDTYDAHYDPQNYYSGTVKSGFQWGAGIEYVFRPQICIELLYLRHETTAPTTYQAGAGEDVKSTDFKMELNYIMLAVERHFPNYNRKIDGYIGVLGGTTVADIRNPDNGNSGSITKFAWGMRLGCNVFSEGKIGLKVQAQILSSAQAMGGETYFGTYGTAVAMASYSNIYQFSLGGGITYKFGR
jgi:hypothetical protein